MKMEQKKVQEKAKREHRRVMMAVDEFLKVEIKMIDWLFFWCFCPSQNFPLVTEDVNIAVTFDLC